MTTDAPPTTLPEWLRAQLDADEAVALAATPGPWSVVEHAASVAVTNRWQRVTQTQRRSNDNAAEVTSAYIAANSPAEALRHIRKDRALVELASEWVEGGMEYAALADAGRHILRTLALPYADRPGYREEWRP